MAIGKIINDNSVKYIPKHEKTREIKQNTIKNKSNPRKQNEKTSQNKEIFLNNKAAQGFGILK